MKYLLPLLLLVPSLSYAQRPSKGKVKLHVVAGEADVYKGLQQRAADLEESAKDVRRHLGKNKWSEVTRDVEEADIRIVVLGRRDDPDKGIAIGYSLDAGAYKTEDEVFDANVAGEVMSGASSESRSGSGANANKSTAKYEDLALQFARSLDSFCQTNYDRIVAQRK